MYYLQLWFQKVEIMWTRTLASSTVSVRAGGSSKQKNSRTKALQISTGVFKTSLTNVWRPAIRPSRKLGAKLSPNHFFFGSDKWPIGNFCLRNCDNKRTKSVYLLKTNQQSPFLSSTRSLYTYKHKSLDRFYRFINNFLWIDQIVCQYFFYLYVYRKAGSFFHDFIANDWYSKIFGCKWRLVNFHVTICTSIFGIIKALYGKRIGMSG